MRRIPWLVLAAVLVLAVQAPVSVSAQSQARDRDGDQKLLAQARPLEPRAWGDFDEYVLALSWQPGFCQAIHDSHRTACDGAPVEPLECARQPELTDRADYLTVHGLWPGLPRSLACRVSPGEWRNVGCAAVGVAYPYVSNGIKCVAPVLDLDADTLRLMAVDMPGANPSSCLARYEYSKHGVCFGFEPNVYFRTAMRLDREIKRGAFGRFLRANYGRKVTREALLNALEPLLGPGVHRWVEVACQRGGSETYLTEIRIPLRREAVDVPLDETSLGTTGDPARNGDQCAAFVLDARGY